MSNTPYQIYLRMKQNYQKGVDAENEAFQVGNEQEAIRLRKLAIQYYYRVEGDAMKLNDGAYADLAQQGTENCEEWLP